MIKISFLGDIMCEPLLLQAARKENSYDFSGMFENVKSLLSESDYVVGNLETPLAGEEAGYVQELFSFNAPDEFAQAIKNAGVDFVSTANNHCMDRGIEGLKRTVQVLNKIGLSHDGTYTDCGEHKPFVVNINGVKIAIISFTYGTNYGTHHHRLPNMDYVDLLHADTDPIYIGKKKGKLSKLKQKLFKPLKPEQIVAIKKALGMEYNSARKDDYLDEKKSEPFFNKLENKIKKAREEADIVIFYPHVGGQFNLEPGRFTEYTVQKALSFGVDAIIASHPHIIQKATINNNVPVFYSIGNFSMSPNSNYLLHENHPEYGLIAHLYIDGKKVIRTTFSIINITEKNKSLMQITPVEKGQDVCIKDIEEIYYWVSGRELGTIEREFEL